MVTFCPRDSLAEKVRIKINETERRSAGVLGLTALRMWSRVGRIGLGPVHRRLHAYPRSFRIDDALMNSLSLFLVLFVNLPRRATLRPIIVASVAQADSVPNGRSLVQEFREPPKTRVTSRRSWILERSDARTRRGSIKPTHLEFSLQSAAASLTLIPDVVVPRGRGAPASRKFAHRGRPAALHKC